MFKIHVSRINVMARGLGGKKKKKKEKKKK